MIWRKRDHGRVHDALDAGGSTIQIQLEEGGVKLLRVSDDGGGMARDELALALTREPERTPQT